jgi:hypothetical protein
MSYIYRIDRDSENSYHRVSAGSFLSVKKVPNISPGQKVAIYAKNGEMEGIFSFVTIKEARTYKTSEIEDNKNQHFLNRNFFQIPIQTGGYSTVPKIDIRYLKHFPSYNSKVFQRPYKPFTLYWSGLLAWEYEYLKYRFSYDFTLQADRLFFQTDIGNIIFIFSGNNPSIIFGTTSSPKKDMPVKAAAKIIIILTSWKYMIPLRLTLSRISNPYPFMILLFYALPAIKKSI